MKKLFNLDNPFMQAMARIGDLMLLSVITLALCLPIVTFGPAVTALFKTVYALTLDTCGGVVSTYFRAFKDNFKQAAVAGLFMLLALAALVCDVILLWMFFMGTICTVLLCLVGVLAFLVIGVTAYLFPLVARYSNTLMEHLHNAAILMVMYLPRTFLTVLLHLSPVLLLIFRPEFLLQTLVVWFFLAPGIIAQADAYILKPVFEKLEGKDGSGEDAQGE